MDTWKDIPGFESNYQASIFGMIRSKKRIVYKGPHRAKSEIQGKIISPWIDSTGYLKVDLYVNGKKYSEKVHQLVARTFIPNPLNKETVNHIDENTLNNTVHNLEWMTNEENLLYGTRAQRMREKHGIKVIRISPDFHQEIYPSLHEAEYQTGICRQSISYAIKAGTKLHGYIWKAG